MALISRLGNEIEPTAPITLPTLAWLKKPADEDEREIAEAAARAGCANTGECRSKSLKTPHSH